MIWLHYGGVTIHLPLPTVFFISPLTQFPFPGQCGLVYEHDLKSWPADACEPVCEDTDTKTHTHTQA